MYTRYTGRSIRYTFVENEDPVGLAVHYLKGELASTGYRTSTDRQEIKLTLAS